MKNEKLYAKLVKAKEEAETAFLEAESKMSVFSVLMGLEEFIDDGYYFGMCSGGDIVLNLPDEDQDSQIDDMIEDVARGGRIRDLY